MKPLSKFLMAAAVVAPAMASAQSWTKDVSYQVGSSNVSVYTASIPTSATTTTDALTTSAKGCLSIDVTAPTSHLSKTFVVKVSPLLTGAISATAVSTTAVLPTGNHVVVEGQARRVWITTANLSNSLGGISATVTDISDCQR